MMSDAAPRHRWCQFSLRTLFVVVTLWGLWLGYAASWIHQRQTFIRGGGIAGFRPWGDEPGPLAPGGLWMLGEHGYYRIFVVEPDSANEAALIDSGRRLFP